MDARAALEVAYRDLIAIVTGLDDTDAWQPSGCLGWAVQDLMYHLLGDARRALVALAGSWPEGEPAATGSDPPGARSARPVGTGTPDRDAVTYWADFPGETGTANSVQIAMIRTTASPWPRFLLAERYAETAQAVLSLAGRTPPAHLIATQGHVLRADDLLATLTVEAAVHHLDLVLHLDRPGPAAAPLAQVRRVLDGLLGHPGPAWDDATWARIGTGRQALTPAQRTELGPAAARLPLFA